MNVALVDTSAYLNLARCLHPMFGRTFGPPPWTAQGAAELQREFEDKPSLGVTYYWFSEPSYADNRSANVFDWKSVNLMEVRASTDGILQYCRANSKKFRDAQCSVPSPADCLLAGYAAALVEAGRKAAVVTDDKGLHLAIRMLATSEVMHGYEMLAHFVSAGHVTRDAAKALYQELAYLSNVPTAWRLACKSTFGFPCP
ncbi:hypothetical protein [Hydrogenophaga crocea]|uniref:PIN domain-containing protein n=1 Tax=Hydrogenophaga crocea TaxID=2716225 RepID=A0A6G8IFE1_9BURK|nr:hypothetical protein [Hydrogenophaga crocea]QIM51700.1 hypothetical protein G9Q37_05860 [Hydrogenophaga crocea]